MKKEKRGIRVRGVGKSVSFGGAIGVWGGVRAESLAVTLRAVR